MDVSGRPETGVEEREKAPICLSYTYSVDIHLSMGGRGEGRPARMGGSRVLTTTQLHDSLVRMSYNLPISEEYRSDYP